MHFFLNIGPTLYHIFSKIYSHHTQVPQVPNISCIKVDGWGLFYCNFQSNTQLFQELPKAITCTFVRNIQCVLLTSLFTWHCFTINEHVQYPSEVSLVPCKHCLHCQRSCLIPQCSFLHLSLLPDSVIASPLQIFVQIYEFIFSIFGICIEVGWYYRVSLICQDYCIYFQSLDHGD